MPPGKAIKFWDPSLPQSWDHQLLRLPRDRLQTKALGCRNAGAEQHQCPQPCESPFPWLAVCGAGSQAPFQPPAISILGGHGALSCLLRDPRLGSLKLSWQGTKHFTGAGTGMHSPSQGGHGELGSLSPPPAKGTTECLLQHGTMMRAEQWGGAQ